MHSCERFMTGIINWLMNKGITFPINISVIVLNNVNSDPKRALNLILLIVKHYIYQCRCLKKKLNFHELINNIKVTKN